MVQIYRGQTPQFETYFDGFQHFLQTLILFLLITTICMVGFVLLFIPGLIAAVGLSQAFYVLQDRPELGAIEALKESWRLVWSQGHFWKVVGLGLLSLFVILLGALAFGIGLFFAIPVVSVAGAGLYDELKGPVRRRGRALCVKAVRTSSSVCAACAEKDLQAVEIHLVQDAVPVEVKEAWVEVVQPIAFAHRERGRHARAGAPVQGRVEGHPSAALHGGHARVFPEDHFDAGQIGHVHHP